MGVEGRVETIKGRAIRADDLVVVAEVEENMGMIERRIGANAHEFLRTDLDDRDAGIIVEVRNRMVGHQIHLGRQWTGAINTAQQAENAAHHTGGYG